MKWCSRYSRTCMYTHAVCTTFVLYLFRRFIKKTLPCWRWAYHILLYILPGKLCGPTTQQAGVRGIYSEATAQTRAPLEVCNKTVLRVHHQVSRKEEQQQQQQHDAIIILLYDHSSIYSADMS